TYKIWPDVLQIVPLAGETIKVPFTSEECLDLLHKATTAFHSLNATVLTGDPLTAEALAAPSPNNCRFCSYRPACNAYQKVRHSGGTMTDWPNDAVGIVWDINVLQNSLVNLQVAGATGEQYTFRSLSLERNPALRKIQRGEQVGIFNARINSGGREFSESQLSVLYTLPNTGVPSVPT
ncbi:MAG: hypothetical protein NTV70_10285, partial [Acidobacteria bacterium]|nr:hypothetical protein [Acidobacteriota bacterium]